MKYHTFLPRFHDLIRTGSKVTTIRGSTRVKPGERFALRHWTGRPYGSPMGFLGTATCERVIGIALSWTGFRLADDTAGDPDEMAVRDGFPSWSAMRDHFGKRLPFDGVLIAWGDFKAGAP